MAGKPFVPFIKLNPPITIVASIKQEPHQLPPSLPPPEFIPPQPSAVVKPEPEQKQPPQNQVEQEQHHQHEPQFLKSINDLATLSSAIHAFKCRFDELTKHLDFINQAIDSKLSESVQEQCFQIETQPPPKSTQVDNRIDKKGPETASPLKSSRSEIQFLCERMCSKELRRYIVGNLSNVAKLREEVPAALKLAPKPAKLVLDCIGRFFLQGIKAYTKDSPMIPARQASVLVLEFFLLMMGSFRLEGEMKMASDIKAEAEQGAVAWRKRLINEGGLNKASEVDARGLLLFVACFGIPRTFRSEDLGNLLRLCNLRAISDALKGSPSLLARMPVYRMEKIVDLTKSWGPEKAAVRFLDLSVLINSLLLLDIIEGMAKNGMYVEAVDVASIFGLEDKFSPKTILTSFLKESTKSFKRARQEATNSPVALKKANEKQLDALKSIVQYMEDRSSDVTKLLGSWQIEEKIVKLEEEIAELHKRIEDKKTMPKRKVDEMVSSRKVKSQESKRSRFASKGSPLQKSSHVNGLHEQRNASLADGIRSYDGLIANSLDSAISGHVSNYPAASSVPHGSNVGSLSENGVGHMVGISGVGSSSMGTAVGVHSANYYSGAYGYGDKGVDNTYSGAYAYGDKGVDNAGQVISSSGLPYGWQHGSAEQSASMRFSGLFGSSQSVEGFAGLPDLPSSGASDRTTADLYRFADSVGEIESYSSSSHRTGTLPTVAPIHHSSYSYMYK
ncbi:Frigida-like protein [Corchorus olitorius]|uniref:FRIGIDA-like protein n=1 Tax=Corchorus olitorius TaxID=93759 RepID=A0A1R3G2S7_9ROSI|nr:Frigida-like protein [Corchorus olitorius]